MNFDGKPLRELTETNLRQCIDSGVAEHLYLDYKEQLYDNGHGGRRDFLLDVCMFANAQGGILLIGVPELRDEKGKPTGLPDSAAQLGVEVENAEAVLLSYDGRIASCIEERLAIESHAIAISGGRYVLALRVPDSIRKPHCVRLDGHIYFPSRRERNLYHMGVTEIKDLSMRAASQLERAERLALDTLNQAEHADGPAVIMTIVPIFFRDFLVDIKHDATYKAFEHFTVGGAHRDFTSPTFAV